MRPELAKDTLLDRFGRMLASRLHQETSGYEPFTPSDPEVMRRTLRPGDVILIEGNDRLSAAIKYLTQSTWSHAAFYAGRELPWNGDEADRPELIEVTLGDGCIASPLRKYETYNTRICRPSGLVPEDADRILAFMVASVGRKYDLKNIVDLLRYFLPAPPVPVRWRRKMIAFGSGDPTRAICSTLIAEAFQMVRYPILPDIQPKPGQSSARSSFSRREILHIRHHSLYAPRDFDLSPFFRIVKPTLEYGFDYKEIEWGDSEIKQA
ncbi:lipo-like protein [Rhizobium sp. KVB221]|uniref:Lipo-like protein n=1 Tax=Rhizobium setariae TaxID=2801340 RepID=A0A936YQD3_9HYPH|nr:lipo-like protein [Rhizobium setariae]MBL0372581.1 lipo-like protein [Rhizobium setariae]